jgi:cytochrome b involved in lipid metabolism
MKKTILTIAVASIFLTSCSLIQEKPVPPAPAPKLEETTQAPTTDTAMEKKDTPSTDAPATTAKSYTATEVAGHADSTSCWLILDNKVYDVTTFIPKHPGGEAILK